jgi:hypothetical protein
MQKGFTRGLFVGSFIGASISMMLNSDMVKPSKRRRMMRYGRTILRRSGHAIGDIIDILR